MKTNTDKIAEHEPGLVQAPTPKAQALKLGLDVHADRYVVCRQIDGNTPQPAQTFDPATFLEWVSKQFTLAERVYSCYEAGPFGYGLHRALTVLGVTNYVVRPRDWDQYGQLVKTDRRDARRLVLELDRYVAGNRDAFCVVRVPTPAEEQARSVSRARQSFQEEKQRLAAKGRSTALYYGHRLAGEWFAPDCWKALVPTLPPIVKQLLQPLQRLITAVEQELAALTRQVEAAAPADLPLGMGRLTAQVLEREICDWQRFANRRQVASYTGMCPREDTSAQRRFQGPINKHGNPRVRATLIELSWRLMQFQPGYRPVVQWRRVLSDPKTTKAKRKQVAVAIGRRFSVDWWRVRTARCRPGALGLTLKPVAAPSPTPTSLAYVLRRLPQGADWGAPLNVVEKGRDA
jgi:transposase